MRLLRFSPRYFRGILGIAVSLAAGILVLPITARGGMIVTAAGVSEGFSLSSFSSGYSSGSAGQPRGIAFTSSGVLVSDTSGNVLRYLSDSDGQNAASAIVAQNYGSFNATDLATVGSRTYLTGRITGELWQLNPDGTLNQVIDANIPNATGLVADPSNGHLYVSSLTNNNIYDVDPIAKTKTVIFNANFDGIALSADGKTLYGASGNDILGYSLVTHSLVFDSGFIAGIPDGAAIGLGPLLGNIYANTNGGTFVQINLMTLAQTVIGTGGSRGDFVTLDPNGSLLLTQTDSILRLTPPPGGFGNPAPEPATIHMAAIAAIAGMITYRRRKRVA